MQPQIQQASPRERRTRRSNDTVTALGYQLALAQSEGGFDALVLANSDGCLVAGVGASPTCEMLAAYAPFLSRRSQVNNELLATTISRLTEYTEVRSLDVDGIEVLLCGRRKPTQARAQELLARTASGCQRILSTRAA